MRISNYKSAHKCPNVPHEAGACIRPRRRAGQKGAAMPCCVNAIQGETERLNSALRTAGGGQKHKLQLLLPGNMAARPR